MLLFKNMEVIQKEVGLKIPAWALVVIGVLSIAGVLFFASSILNATDEYRIPGDLIAQGSEEFHYGPQPVLSDPDYFKTVETKMIEEKVSFIKADLSLMTLTLYTKGEKEIEVPIASKGREGSWWETPAGIYQIQTKAENHFSSFGEVYQPYSLAFQGNFFIHGWPYYPDGTDVPQSYSGGCIRLDTEDAKKIFARAETGMPVLVFEKDFDEDTFEYNNRLQGVTAESYLAVDLGNNFVFASHNANEERSIASITKLMTAVVATEFINIEKEVLIPQSLGSTSIPRLIPGEAHTIYSLLYPLLLESSNESADVIAESIGRRWFIDRMNKKGEAIGLTHTTFADPSGVSGSNMSTAEDLFRLAKYLYNNRSFILSVSMDDLGFTVYGDPSFVGLVNLNDIPDLSHMMVGGKVGDSSTAGETMLAVFDVPLQGEVRPVAVVVLGSRDKKGDVRRIVSHIMSRY